MYIGANWNSLVEPIIRAGNPKNQQPAFDKYRGRGISPRLGEPEIISQMHQRPKEAQGRWRYSRSIERVSVSWQVAILRSALCAAR